MNKNKIKRLFLSIGILLCGICGTKVVFADDLPSSTLTVSPPYQNIVLMPGESYRGAITISNTNDAKQDLQYSAFVGSFSQNGTEDSKDDYDSVDIVAESSYNQIMGWIELDKETGEIAPNTSEALGFTIKVPENAPAGGQYATIVVKNDTGKTTDNVGNVAIQNDFQFASIIYAEVAGETKEIGEILENSVPSVLLEGPLKAESLVKNNGNVHTNAEYTLQVWPLFSGEEICTNEENPTLGLVLPETRKYVTQTCDLPSFGIFSVKQVVKIFGETSVVEKTIIACPIWLLFIIIFAIIILITWLILRAKSRSKRNRKTAAESE